MDYLFRAQSLLTAGLPALASADQAAMDRTLAVTDLSPADAAAVAVAEEATVAAVDVVVAMAVAAAVAAALAVAAILSTLAPLSPNQQQSKARPVT